MSPQLPCLSVCHVPSTAHWLPALWPYLGLPRCHSPPRCPRCNRAASSPTPLTGNLQGRNSDLGVASSGTEGDTTSHHTAGLPGTEGHPQPLARGHCWATGTLSGHGAVGQSPLSGQSWGTGAAPTWATGHLLVLRHRGVVQLLVDSVGDGICSSARAWNETQRLPGALATVGGTVGSPAHLLSRSAAREPRKPRTGSVPAPTRQDPPRRQARARHSSTARAPRARHSSVPSTTHRTVGTGTVPTVTAAALLPRTPVWGHGQEVSGGRSQPSRSWGAWHGNSYLCSWHRRDGG